MFDKNSKPASIKRTLDEAEANIIFNHLRVWLFKSNLEALVDYTNIILIERENVYIHTLWK